MKKFIPFIFLVFSLVSYAQECQKNLAFATAGTATVSTVSGKSAQNGVVAYGFFNPFACNTTGVAYVVLTADSSTTDHYGWAIVGTGGGSTAGTVYASSAVVSGVTFSTAVNQIGNAVWLSGPINLPVGYYILALGTDCSASCAALYGDTTRGAFFPYISADTAANTPWTFNSGGFSGFTSGNVPITTLGLKSAGNSISGTTATIAINSTSIGHIYAGSTISVAGVTTSGATNLNCSSCIVTTVNYSTDVVTYTVASATFSSSINAGATVSVVPIVDSIAGLTAPTTTIY